MALRHFIGFLPGAGAPSSVPRALLLLSTVFALLFPWASPLLTIIVLSLYVVVLLGDTVRRPPIHSPLDPCVSVLLVCALTASYISAWPAMAIEKLCGLTAGIVAWRAMVTGGAVPSRDRIFATSYIVVGALLAGFALSRAVLSTKLPVIGALATLLGPTLPSGTFADRVVNPNAVGALVLMFLPLAFAQLAGDRHDISVPSGTAARPWWTSRSILPAVASLVLATVLLATQSRAAILAAVSVSAASTVLLLDRGRRVVVLLCGATVAAAILLVGISLSNSLADTRSVSVPARLELWDRAARATSDLPLTGVGLGGFRYAVHAVYPVFSFDSSHDIAHAHNIVLQVFLDVGLPGLVAYVAMMGSALVLGLRVALAGVGATRWLVVGSLANIAAVHLFGLVDAVPLGAKVGVFMWVSLGIVTSQCAIPAIGRAHSVDAPI